MLISSRPPVLPLPLTHASRNAALRQAFDCVGSSFATKPCSLSLNAFPVAGSTTEADADGRTSIATSARGGYSSLKRACRPLTPSPSKNSSPSPSVQAKCPSERVRAVVPPLANTALVTMVPCLMPSFATPRTIACLDVIASNNSPIWPNAAGMPASVGNEPRTKAPLVR